MATRVPLDLDPETRELITSGARFLGIGEEELVADAVRTHVARARKKRPDAEREKG